MRMTKAVEAGINKQINMEFQSAYHYLAMSAYCERTFFPGCAKWLRAQSGEEEKHAMKLYEFMRERNARIELLPLAAPPVDFKDIPDVFEQALQHEIKVSDSINELYELTQKERNYATSVELQWFLMEQVEEEKQSRDIVERIKRIKDDPAAMIDLDRELGSRTE